MCVRNPRPQFCDTGGGQNPDPSPNRLSTLIRLTASRILRRWPQQKLWAGENTHDVIDDIRKAGFFRLNSGRSFAPMRYPALRMAVDPDLISALLREHLSPWQEKVVRLYFGLRRILQGGRATDWRVAAGHLTLKICLVQEGVTWFIDAMTSEAIGLDEHGRTFAFPSASRATTSISGSAMVKRATVSAMLAAGNAGGNQ